MRYLSTRGECPEVSFSEAVATGLAPDGGLYLPAELPDISGQLTTYSEMDYAALARAFFSHFATDIDSAELDRLVADAYSRFDDPAIAPLVPLGKEPLYVLELFHGPTLAFKDFALQLLGNLYEAQIARTQEPINVLGATSGDTGSAAIHGLLDRQGVHSFILYPEGRISPLQERQMTCTDSSSVFPIAIEGTFDDAQRIIKDLFGEAELKARLRLSAINSINLARILAQCVYYIWAWLRLPEAHRRAVEFVVPTGNFGNVLAGWMAQKMGLPVTSFRVATNQNDILYRLFTTGRYKLGDVAPSLAPSMDVQVASNFERFLYYAEQRQPARVRAVMRTFRETGLYTFDNFDADTFTASRTNDGEIPSIIEDVYSGYNYVADPHTACGFARHDPHATTVVLATAHPAKFPDTIERAIGQHPTHPRLEALKRKEPVKYRLPAETAAVREFLETHALKPQAMA
ncbi:MAG: threonine synthase [Opitutales bacterium]